jgi:nicotinamide-nucleotide amidase
MGDGTVDPREDEYGVRRTRERCESLAQDVMSLAIPRPASLAVAESLTAGLVTGTLASVAGASAVLRGGVVAYATDLKTELLGVDELLLEHGGAVQAEVALAMAEGVARRLGAGYGVGTTGVAGPDPQDGQPPGTVFVAVVASGARRVVARSGDTALAGGRALIRWSAVELALDLLADQLRAEQGAHPSR